MLLICGGKRKENQTGVRLQIQRKIRARSGQQTLPTTSIKDIKEVLGRVFELFLYKY